VKWKPICHDEAAGGGTGAQGGHCRGGVDTPDPVPLMPGRLGCRGHAHGRKLLESSRHAPPTSTQAVARPKTQDEPAKMDGPHGTRRDGT